MDIFREKQAFEYFSSKEIFNNENADAEIEDIQKLIWEALDILQKPIPSEIYKVYFYTPEILSLLTTKIWNEINYDKRMLLISKDRGSKNIAKLIPKDKSHFTFRILGESGVYPNISFNNERVTYTPYAGAPFLITEESIEEMLMASEVSFLNKNELIAAAGIILTSTETRLHFSFDSSPSINLTRNLYLKLNEQLRIPFVMELMSILDEKPVSTNYTYGNYQEKIKDLQIFYTRVETSNELLLRTFFFLIKSIMLWENRMFGEDAISNVFFSIEGALLLMQLANGTKSDKIDLILLQKVFNEQFENGADLFEFIQEAYDKRVDIVHPNPRGKANWCPDLLADDFYEYYEIVIELINYYLVKSNK